MLVDSGTHEYKDVTEINANLKYVVDELDNLTQGVPAFRRSGHQAENLRDLRIWKKWCRTRSAK
jgi:phage terminase Nu1 subunit (DNA packaging protein)